MSLEPEGGSSRNRRGRRKLLLGAAGLLGLMLAAWLASEADWPEARLDVERNVSRQSAATELEAANNLDSQSLVVSGEGTRLLARRLAVIGESDHPLMAEATEVLAPKLRSLGFVEHVDVYPPGEVPGEIDLVHDLYILLSMPEIDVSGSLPGGRTVEAEIAATCGQSPHDSRRGYHDDLSPPVLDIGARIRLQHRSTTTGHETPGDAFGPAGRNVGEQLADSLTGSLTDWAAKHGLMREVPEGLVPSYRPVPDGFPLPEAPHPRMLLSGPGLMHHNYTTWTARTDRPREVLKTYRDRLAEAGWKVNSETWEPESHPFYHFRAWGDAGEQVEAFRVRRDGMPVPEGQEVLLAIEYRNRIQRGELKKVIDALLADPNAQPLELARYRQMMTRPQRRRLLRLLEAASPRQPGDMLTYARLLKSFDRDGRALKILRDSLLFARAIYDTDAEKQVEKLGEEIAGSDDWQPAPPTEVELAELGFRPMTEGETAELELGLSQPGYFYMHVEPGETWDEPLLLISVEVAPAEIPEGVYTLRLGRGHPGRSRGSTFSTPHDPPSPWRGRVSTGYNEAHWYAEAVEVQPERFRITLRTDIKGAATRPGGP